jgi:putative addiction module component (TIGR02574 family)
MSSTVDAIAADAGRLPVDQRLTLAHRILTSVEPLVSSEIENAWDGEVRRRIADFDAGKVVGVPAADVFSELERRLRR